MTALGRHFVDPGRFPFGTDFVNVSQRVPSALIGIGRPAGGPHTDDGAEQFERDGEECALDRAGARADVVPLLQAQKQMA